MARISRRHERNCKVASRQKRLESTWSTPGVHLKLPPCGLPLTKSSSLNSTASPPLRQGQAAPSKDKCALRAREQGDYGSSRISGPTWTSCALPLCRTREGVHGHDLHRYLRELRPLLGQPHSDKVQPLAERPLRRSNQGSATHIATRQNTRTAKQDAQRNSATKLRGATSKEANGYLAQPTGWCRRLRKGSSMAAPRVERTTRYSDSSVCTQLLPCMLCDVCVQKAASAWTA